MEKERQKSSSALKKIHIAKGSLQGAFYFASASNGDENVLVIRIVKNKDTAKDVVNRGKKHARTMPGMKYLQGKVLVEQNKLVFAMKKGTGTPKLMKSVCVAKIAPLDNFSSLRKAIYKKVEEEHQIIEENVEKREGTVPGQDVAVESTGIPVGVSQLASMPINTKRKRRKALRSLQKREAMLLEDPTDHGYQQLHKKRIKFVSSAAIGENPFTTDILPPEMFIASQVAAMSSIEGYQSRFAQITKKAIQLAEGVLASEEEHQKWKQEEVIVEYTALYEATVQLEHAIEVMSYSIPVHI